MLLVGLFGMVFNTVAICILLTKELVGSPFNNLVVALAIIDNTFLLTSVFYHVAHAFQLQIKNTLIHKHLFVYLLYPSHSITMCCSTYMIVILALDRYNSVSQPSKYNSTIKTTNPIFYVICYTVPVLVFAIMFNIPKYFELEIDEQIDWNKNRITWLGKPWDPF